MVVKLRFVESASDESSSGLAGACEGMQIG